MDQEVDQKYDGESDEEEVCQIFLAWCCMLNCPKFLARQMKMETFFYVSEKGNRGILYIPVVIWFSVQHKAEGVL